MATITASVPAQTASPPMSDPKWRSPQLTPSSTPAYQSARAPSRASMTVPDDNAVDLSQLPSINPLHILSQKIGDSDAKPPVVYRVAGNKVDIRQAPQHEHQHLGKLAHAVVEKVERVVEDVIHSHHESAAVALSDAPGPRRESCAEVSVDPAAKKLSVSPARASDDNFNLRPRDLPSPIGAPPSPPPSVSATDDDVPSVPPLSQPTYASSISTSPTSTTSALTPGEYMSLTPAITPKASHSSQRGRPDRSMTDGPVTAPASESPTRSPSRRSPRENNRRTSDELSAPSFVSTAVSSTYGPALYPRIMRNDEPLDDSPTITPHAFFAQSPPPISTSPADKSYLSPEVCRSPPPITTAPAPAQHSPTRGPTRRNTTGSSSKLLPAGSSRPTRALINAHATHMSTGSPSTLYSPFPFPLDEDVYGSGEPPGELDSDILKRAEQIRRERLNKRAKMQQQEAEEAAMEREARAQVEGMAAAAGAVGGPRGLEAEDGGALVGHLIGEQHPNYILMYNMLTGIRIGVSRCQAKIKRPLTDEDYTARHKYSFDIVGNELTPSARYDFKFKDYAPWVFRELRDECFHLDPADYLLSLTSKYILTELGSPGKSGSFFYFSSDYRFIIKTIHHSEHKFLRAALKEYHHHVKANPHTLLSRFYGLHRVKLPRGHKIHFVIMNNLFPPHRDIHETYDLKGSTVGRELSEEKLKANPRAVLKDLNWINRGKTLELGPEKRALFSEQVRRDSELLKRLNVMDYSLLVGIHNMERGNRDNVRRNTLHVVQPDVRRKPSQLKGHAVNPALMRRAIRQSEVKPVESQTNLAEENCADRRDFIFYRDEGGYRATDEANLPMDTIYYLGIIDICTPYTAFKKIENFWKGLSADRHKISPVPAEEYGNRFFRFLMAVTRGGEGGQRFKPAEKHKAVENGGRITPVEDGEKIKTE